MKTETNNPTETNTQITKFEIPVLGIYILSALVGFLFALFGTETESPVIFFSGSLLTLVAFVSISYLATEFLSGEFPVWPIPLTAITLFGLLMTAAITENPLLFSFAIASTILGVSIPPCQYFSREKKTSFNLWTVGVIFVATAMATVSGYAVATRNASIEEVTPFQTQKWNGVLIHFKGGEEIQFIEEERKYISKEELGNRRLNSLEEELEIPHETTPEETPPEETPEDE